jgi:hypothetical protein
MGALAVPTRRHVLVSPEAALIQLHFNPSAVELAVTVKEKTASRPTFVIFQSDGDSINRTVQTTDPATDV